MRIDAAEVTRSYIHCTPIPVAPGEGITVAAWARIRDVPPDKGMVIIIADFANTGGGEVGAPAKVAVARQVADWQLLQGTVRVPAEATSLRLRFGFTYSRGTVWWDDIRATPAAGRVVRAVLPDNRLYPAAKGVAVELLNREQRKGRADVRITLGGRTADVPVTLSGEAIQSVLVPCTIGGPGKKTLKLALLEQGRAVFSSGEITAIVPPPVTLNPLSPTHWAIEDGEPEFVGRIDLALPDTGAGRPSLTVRVLDEGGQVRATWHTNGGEAPLSGTVEFTLRAPGLVVGRYRVVAEAGATDGTPAGSEQGWGILRRESARVTLNAGGYPEQAGRALFPLGMFNNGARTEESAAAGFNIVHFYNAARVQAGRRPDDQRLKDGMDRAEKSGMRCLLMVPLAYAFAGEWDAFTRRIRMFRNHPALLAWDEEEGIARGDMKPETLRRIRRIVQAEDPHHPLMVGDARDVIGRIADRSRFFPADCMDLGMWWWYPFPLRPGKADDLQGEQATTGLTIDPPLFLTGAATGQPIWVGVQAYKKNGPGARYPTPAEYRVQAYLGVIHGAKGLMWYGGSVTGGLFLSPKEGHWDELKALVSELRGLEPLLVAPPGPCPVTQPAGSNVVAATRQAGGRRILMAANRGPTDCEVTLAASALGAGAVPVLNENRSVTPGAGGIRDRFGPYGVHVYELPPE